MLDPLRGWESPSQCCNPSLGVSYNSLLHWENIYINEHQCHIVASKEEAPCPGLFTLNPPSTSHLTASLSPLHPWGASLGMLRVPQGCLGCWHWESLLQLDPLDVTMLTAFSEARGGLSPAADGRRAADQHFLEQQL